MKRLLATLLLVCVGLLLPASACPSRICLLDLALKCAAQESKCCEDCDRDSPEPGTCCIDLEEIPDAPAPQPLTELPPLIGHEAPADFLPRALPDPFRLGSAQVRCPIRGPTSPSAFRAVLGIWRL